MKSHHFVSILALLLVLVLSPFLSYAHAAEPEIQGSKQFIDQIRQALDLMKTRDADAYKIVVVYIGRIQQGQRSGMWAYKTPPTYEISDATAFYSVTWCAATIAHDSFHSKLYHDYHKATGGSVPDSVWTGVTAEQQCMKHQLAVMQKIGATQWEIDYATKQKGGHYIKVNESWDEYRKRKW